jgi:hypothetical protein
LKYGISLIMMIIMSGLNIERRIGGQEMPGLNILLGLSISQARLGSITRSSIHRVVFLYVPGRVAILESEPEEGSVKL